MSAIRWLLTCNKCYRSLPEEAFDPHPYRPGEFRGSCQECYAKTKNYRSRPDKKPKKCEAAPP